MREFAPCRYDVDTTMVAYVSMHALARRLQRGADQSDTAVMADLAQLAKFALDDGHERAPGDDFSLNVPGGTFLGLMTVVDGKLLPSVRTFVV